ncbi:MAG TPA: DNA-directed RNA polymerase [archaeon]|nr:DNA-directed RNA polymerase [archaeon]
MYNIATLRDVIAVPPAKFDKKLDEAVKESIQERLEGRVDNQIGVLLTVVSVEEIGEGIIEPGDPAVHYDVKFKMLCWMPKEQELVEGEVIDITEFGAFVRIGAMDGLVHVSQILDDYVSYDQKNLQLSARESRKVLKVGDTVRARVISIRLKEQSKIGLTMRQHLLGSHKWLAEKPEKAEKPQGKERGKK